MVKDEKKVEEKKEEKSKRYIIGEVATQTDLVIIDQSTQGKYTVLTILAKLANDIEEIKELMG